MCKPHYLEILDLNATQGVLATGSSGLDGHQAINKCGYFFIGPNVGDFYNVSGPWTPFGTGHFMTWDTSNGDLFALGGNPVIGVPAGYVSGDPLSANATQNGATFVSLGFTRGSYVTTLANGNLTDTVTINVVPEPTSFGLICLVGLAAVTRGGEDPAVLCFPMIRRQRFHCCLLFYENRHGQASRNGRWSTLQTDATETIQYDYGAPFVERPVCRFWMNSTHLDATVYCHRESRRFSGCSDGARQGCGWGSFCFVRCSVRMSCFVLRLVRVVQILRPSAIASCAETLLQAGTNTG